MTERKHCSTHCTACGRCFTSTQAFDFHRGGSHRKNTRHCIDPMLLEGSKAMSSFTGTCPISRGRDTPVPDVVIYTQASSQSTSIRPQTGLRAA